MSQKLSILFFNIARICPVEWNHHKLSNFTSCFDFCKFIRN